jgi:hypothetical protein
VLRDFLDGNNSCHGERPRSESTLGPIDESVSVSSKKEDEGGNREESLGNGTSSIRLYT